MAENKRTKMLAITVRMSPEDPAGSIQKHIDEAESKGHYVMQYVSVNQYDGVLLVHDYPDKKNADADSDKRPAAPKGPPTEPDGSPAKPVTDNLTTREGLEIPPVNAPDLNAPEAVKLDTEKESAKTPAKGKKR